MALFLATKEMIRNKFRFIAVILIVALVMLLVIFLAALGDGLAQSAKEYIESIDAELVVFQADVDYSIPASQLGTTKLNNLRRVEGVEAAGPVGFSVASIMLSRGDVAERLEVALIGVEPGMPGAPSVFQGRTLADERVQEIVLDQHILNHVDLPVGTLITLKVTQGAEEQFYEFTVVGHTSGKKFNFLPSAFVSLDVWNRVKPQEVRGGNSGEPIFNIVAVKLADPASDAVVASAIEQNVQRTEVTDLVTTYSSTQGFNDMQSIIGTQQNLVLLIGLLIIGGFFQIQALQKIVQVGMLKALGASNGLIAGVLLIQVTLTTLFGLLIGGLGIGILASIVPSTVPFVFDGQKILIAIITLLLIAPLASLISLRTLVKVEPLRALGLGG